MYFEFFLLSMNISTIFEEIGDKWGWRFRLFNILISFNRCLVLKIWYIGIRNYWDICHRQIADGEKIKPSGGVIIFALCLSITSLIITQVEWKRDREKRTMLFYFTSNIPQEHIAVRTHQSRDSPIECWSTETHCKIELTSTVWKANLPLSKCAASMQWQEVNGLFSNLHSLFIISSQNFLMVMILCSTYRKMKLHKDNESIIRPFAKLSTDYSIMQILRQKFTNQTILFWLDNRKLEEKQYKKAHNLSHLILIHTVTAN